MSARIALVGEAWGADEKAESEKQGRPMPFVGASGNLLNAALRSAGVIRDECFLTNILNLQPPGNDFAALMVSKKEGVPGWPPLQKGKYYPPVLLHEIQRMHRELAEWNPDVIVTLGSKALWSLCHVVGLSNRHGFLHEWTAWSLESGSAPGTLVIPTWHPASVLRSYSQFLPLVNDIRKARRLAEGAISSDEFSYNAAPSLDDLRAFLRDIVTSPPPAMCVDIETKPEFRSITHIGFGTSEFGICCPFWDPSRDGQSYWDSVETEVEALGICRDICATPITKVTQNGAYDMTWLRDTFGIELAGIVWDIRLEHFGLFPELPHNLAEIASTWLVMPPWKALHHGGNKDGDAGAGGGEGEG